MNRPKVTPKARPKPEPKPKPVQEFDMVNMEEVEAEIEAEAKGEDDISAESGVLATAGPEVVRVDLDVELLSSMVSDTAALQTVHQSGLHPMLLQDPNLRQVYKEILTFYQKRGFPMTRDIFNQQNPDISLEQNPRAIKEILYDIELVAKRNAVISVEREVHSLLDPDLGGNVYRAENLDEIFNVYRSALSTFNTLFAAADDRVQSFGDGQDIVDAYNARSKGILNGVPICFDLIAEDIPSWEYGQITGFIARPGERKTFLMLYILAKTVIDTDTNGFIHSSEMAPLELKNRIVSLLAGIHYGKFMRGQLEKDERQKLVTFLKSDDSDKLDERLFFAGPTAAQDMGAIEIECAERNIKLIGLDNAITLDAEGEAHIKIQNMMFDMKYMAMRLGAHVLFTSHQNRTGGRGMQGVAYGDAINTWSSNLFNMRLLRGEAIDLVSFKVRSGRGNMQYRIILNLMTGEVKNVGRREVHASQQQQTASAVNI